MTKRARILVAAAIGLVLGAAVGWLVGWLVRSDNAPFFVALGTLAGLWGGLAWARVLRPLLLAAIGLLALALLAIVFTPPRAPIHAPAPLPTATMSPAPRADGLTADQLATLSSLRKEDDYPLYTMRYRRAPGSSGFSRSSPGTTEVVTAKPAIACSLFAARATPRTAPSAASSTGVTAPRCGSLPTGPRRAATRRSRWWISPISASMTG